MIIPTILAVYNTSNNTKIVRFESSSLMTWLSKEKFSVRRREIICAGAIFTKGIEGASGPVAVRKIFW